MAGLAVLACCRVHGCLETTNLLVLLILLLLRLSLTRVSQNLQDCIDSLTGVLHVLPPLQGSQCCSSAQITRKSTLKFISDVVYLQHCPPGRFLMLMGIGALLYLTGLGPLQRALQRLVALALPAPTRAPQAGQGAPPGPLPPAPQWTFLGELQAVIVGFFSSLIPGVCMGSCISPACVCPSH